MQEIASAARFQEGGRGVGYLIIEERSPCDRDAPSGRWYKVNLLLRRDTIQSRMQLCLLYSGASVARFLGVSTSLVKPYGERGGDSRPWFLSRKFTLYQRYILASPFDGGSAVRL